MRKKRKNKFHHKIIPFLLGLGFVLLGLIFVWVSTFKIPDLENFEERKIQQSTKIYDRTGEVLLYDLHQNIKRRVVPLEEISRNIKNATVAIEDAEFYEHRGVRPLAFLRAVLTNLKDLEFSQGGSTITQQVIKNSILTSEKKISRKIKEWVLALKIEKEMTKDEILALYLNEVPYGGSIYGVEEASQSFFGKSSKDLRLSESTYLAALPQAPTFYSPYGNNRDKLEERKNLVLFRMLEEGFITEKEYKEAREEIVPFRQREDVGIKAPHFVFYVIEELESLYGKRALEEEGFKVITSLDYSLQEKAEEIVKKFALENKEKFNAENAGLVATSPQTGEILVMVGSRNYFDGEIDGNFNVTISQRQPGSAFKPFVYATAFSKGYTPETVVFDLQTQFSTTCTSEGTPLLGFDPESCYLPVNYDNVYRGPVTLRNALAQSLNIPSIKTLYLSGLKDSLQTAEKMGISTLSDINRYGLTLVLGGGEVSLLELTSAYSVFANEGKRNQQTAILKVEDSSGNLLQESNPSPVKVLDENIALTISDILSDNEARTPAFGASSLLYFPGKDVAVKTGTTNDYRDAWIIGYTPNIAVGAWAGNNDNSSMEKKVAGFIIAPLWNAFMNEILEVRPAPPFRGPKKERAEGLKPVLRGDWQGSEILLVDKRTGKPAADGAPPEETEERQTTSVHNILYWLDKNNPRGEKPQNPQADPQFKLWEKPVRDWVQKNRIIENLPLATPNLSSSL
ncbi:penicillin-binding protein [Candidatus Campbellbacteria bacterium CG11_big_fil_rev_8_21_14_0_20_44_21]|uniref:Penicillin-binding protein n=1 Tax=Candidatus Campbellbacteria bacterium CG22_combo_CG10-13_8_21_14_all_43_18 TaxID=1974530 RepID=A0A2H0DXP5_9BACT|nr:MAG: penicillin-binding protein [Candidatus Campbellbacteria bacterium CG22_combo_CG10-13_8_21_14_all_43_18]PIR24208.1 MAG: penicillin-binding protein [Candidatus Campbellbacteria bacterium CG11_big_fil_rev_8_21_14_0_20_44_21]